MYRRYLASMSAIAAALFFLPPLASAGGPLINSASFDGTKTHLVITGLHLLGTDGLGPTSVTIGKISPISLPIASFTDTSVVATVTTAAANLAPDTYLLTVVYRTGQVQFNMTIGGGAQQSTTLLFTFVTNQGGFDSGVAITNVTADIGSPGSSGECMINFLGDNPPSPPTVITFPIRGGSYYTFALSQTAPGFQGYMIAHCNFTAQAFAFLSDVGANRFGASLPVIVSTP